MYTAARFTHSDFSDNCEAMIVTIYARKSQYFAEECEQVNPATQARGVRNGPD